MGSVVDDVFNGGQGRAAADKQRMAAEGATALSERQFDITRQDNMPFLQAGQAAIGQLQNDPSLTRAFTAADFDVNKDPGAQYRMEQANKALERSAAARGGLLQGSTLSSLAGLNQNLAAQEFGAARDRYNQDRDIRRNHLASLAGVGQNTAQSLGAAGQNYAAQAGQSMMGAANAQAAYAQGNNAMTGSLIGMGIGAGGKAAGWW